MSPTTRPFVFPSLFFPSFIVPYCRREKQGGEGCLFDSLMNKTRASSHQWTPLFHFPSFQPK